MIFKKASLIFSIVIFFAMGCKKDYKMCTPELEVVNLYQTDKGVVFVEASVKFTDQPIYYWGFAYGTKPEFEIVPNQILVNGQAFATEISNLESDMQYYFKAFVATDCGYEVSKSHPLFIKRPSAPKVPCPLNSNQFKINGNNITMNYRGEEASLSAEGDWAVYGEGGPSKVHFEFLEEPESGVYTATDYENFGLRETDVLVIIDNQWLLNEDTKVYVYNNFEDTLRFSICPANYIINSWPSSFEVSIEGDLLISQ